MPYFELEEEEKRSFLDTYRPWAVDGKRSLVRFTDSTRGHEAAYGRLDQRTGLYRSYWMYATEVQEILQGIHTRGPYGVKILTEVSKRWAICDDWGDLGRTWVMTIPAGKSLSVYGGFAKFQPKISAQAQEETGRTTTNSYPGGSLQLVTRISDQEKHWIKGPIPTLDLSTRKLAFEMA